MNDDGDCGECGEQPTFVEIGDRYTYCHSCLARLVALGRVFEAAMSEAAEFNRKDQG